MSKYNTSIERQIIDKETGEILTIETQKVFTTKVTDDEFYMTFLKFIAPLYELTSNKVIGLLSWMLSRAEFNTGVVTLTTADRRKITEELGIANNTISNYLKALKDKKLISGEKGRFTINPQIFWKGELAARKQLLKDKNIKITFGIED